MKPPLILKMQKLKKFTREELEKFSKEQFIELILLLQDRIEQFEDRLSQLEKSRYPRPYGRGPQLSFDSFW